MKAPEARKYLFDIWQACELLAQFCAGKTLDDYRGDVLLRSAIERQFEIPQPLDPRIFAVSNEVVWGIVEGYLPRLRLEVRRLLETAG